MKILISKNDNRQMKSLWKKNKQTNKEKKTGMKSKIIDYKTIIIMIIKK